jgi:hypothetical protein
VSHHCIVHVTSAWRRQADLVFVLAQRRHRTFERIGDDLWVGS